MTSDENKLNWKSEDFRKCSVLNTNCADWKTFFTYSSSNSTMDNSFFACQIGC